MKNGLYVVATPIGNLADISGLGSHTINLRINNPPELVVIDFM